MANQFNTANTEGVDFTVTYTISTSTPEYPGPPFVLGQVVKGSDESEWVFVQAGGIIAIGNVVTISNAWVANAITTTNASFGALVGVAPIVAFASSDYGWVQRQGKCNAIGVATAAAPNVQLATTATAGVIDDSTATATKDLSGIIITATNNAGSASTIAGTLNFPVVTVTN